MKWKQRNCDEQAASQIQQALGLPLVIAKLLTIRGLKTPAEVRAYMNPLKLKMRDPYLLHDMDKAVQIIKNAQNLKVMIYGDYDVDGITSTAIMHGLLKRQGIDANYYIPKRQQDGYGPNMERYQEFVKQGYQLLITVDNGITGVKEIEYAENHGMHVLITDHHQMGNKLPKASAIVHPLYPDKKYPVNVLSGAGVAFKVAQALDPEYANTCWDLAALGAIADVMELTDENRIIVERGLNQLRTNARPGLWALCQANDLDYQHLNTQDIGFTIAPCLNAIGRLADNQKGAELLMTNSDLVATNDANYAINLNQQRKNIVKQVTQEAMDLVDSEHKVNILVKKDWPAGLVGLVANQVMNKTGKPTLVLSQHGEMASGSGRSNSIDLHKVLLPLKGNILDNFGGHAFACGLELNVNNIPQLQIIMDNACSDVPEPVLEIDAKVAMNTLPRLYQETQFMEPFGQGNEALEVLVEGTLASKKLLGKDQGTLKLTFKENPEIPLINFDGLANIYDQLEVGMNLKCVGTMNLNRFRGKETLQIIIDDLAV